MADTEQSGVTDEIADAAKAEIERAMSMALKGVTSLGGDNFEAETNGLEKELEDTSRVVREDVVYMEPIPDPYGKAIKYLEQHNILQLFQTLTTNIVYRKPEDPLAYMMKEVKKMQKQKQEA
ncbi:uncharacterized protein LOC110455737 [Mizuhopecten yessoensis]|uniref:Uncharacterized protein C3orf30 n=1 Tax=Mizuhopecten yessoensis TaxID=6573 RepID=A0A210QCE7_MIZYE|nr:uncharacterized protein LOC110455737 [Mizuhopecten yessoensis]OWF46427.1 Uncharacterized protein C3orf30 [Mizuhopecten yessoensis]